jgi:hypothetical protein
LVSKTMRSDRRRQPVEAMPRSWSCGHCGVSHPRTPKDPWINRPVSNTPGRRPDSRGFLHRLLCALCPFTDLPHTPGTHNHRGRSRA